MIASFSFDFEVEGRSLIGRGVHKTTEYGDLKLSVVDSFLSYADHLTIVTHANHAEVKDATTFYFKVLEEPLFMQGGWASWGFKTRDIVTGRLLLWRARPKDSCKPKNVVINEHLWFDSDSRIVSRTWFDEDPIVVAQKSRLKGYVVTNE